MSISHKYKTFDQLLNDVSVDLSNYHLEGMIDPQQLIKVAARVNYDLGLKIHRSKDAVLDVEHNKVKLPYDLAYLNYAFICDTYTIETKFPSGTHIDTTVEVPYVPAPDSDNTCEEESMPTNACVVRQCENKPEYYVIHKIGPSQFRTFSTYLPLRIENTSPIVCDCPNVSIQAPNIAEIKDGFLKTNFTSGTVYINYQSSMEDIDGNLLVLDHPYCNEYYEYALKQRILENLMLAGEQVVNQLNLIEVRLRQARITALSFINTPDFKELETMWRKNRKAQHHNYYNMFKSHGTIS